jgi:hypothetical protein
MIVMTDRFVLINPEGLHPTSGYAHITIVEAGRTAHLAGLCPLDAGEQVVGLGDCPPPLRMALWGGGSVI